MERSHAESTQKNPLQLGCRAYAGVACIAIAGIVAVWVLVCLIVALATPWYRLSYNPPGAKSTTMEYYWDDITDGGDHSYGYYDLNGLHSLTTFTLVMLVFSFICWVAVTCAVLAICAGSFIPGLGSKIPMAAGSCTSSVVCCAMCLMCISWVVYAAFFTTALKRFNEPTPSPSDGPWSSFTGKEDDTRWGPTTGWAFTIVGCFCTCLVAIPFAIGTAKDVVVDKDNFAFIKGAMYETV